MRRQRCSRFSLLCLILVLTGLASVCEGSRFKKDWWLEHTKRPNEPETNNAARQVTASTDSNSVLSEKTETEPPSKKPYPGLFTYYWNRFAEWWWPVKVETDNRFSESEPLQFSDDDQSAKEISLYVPASSSSSSLNWSDTFLDYVSEGEKAVRKMSYRNALEIEGEEADQEENQKEEGGLKDASKTEDFLGDPFERKAEELPLSLDSGDTEINEHAENPSH